MSVRGYEGEEGRVLVHPTHDVILRFKSDEVEMILLAIQVFLTAIVTAPSPSTADLSHAADLRLVHEYEPDRQARAEAS